ncbi:TonB-dependent receptor [Thalassomonas actiniarum]|uniref:TonB-dependent receptor n=1 Tax=Thalassomonas actiniarum TaxID=485447 RepID=A0AAF0C1G8_9GAMM|nr:TonB-dependent receptor [Thalassomonas actiniarum]WDD96938.1 TonB-dependent receptor [Thalassomonas actiniarum]
MFKRNLVCQAILYALATGVVSHSLAQESMQTSSQADDDEIETIIVTASKRRQNIQETPIAVHAMSGEALKAQNIGNFDDFVNYMPNVTLGGRGPGQADIFIRGMAIQPIVFRISGAQGVMPNVALYIDEQPVTAPGRNMDVYATDISRIEVLPGPQGTLFGASSQAGTIRYITNKPVFDDFSAGFNVSLADTHKGESSNTIEGYLNLPVNEQLALRAALYNVNRGGYIDNVYGEFTLDPSINPDSAANVPDNSTFETINNQAFVEDDFNSSAYTGFRLGLNYKINDNWRLLVQHAGQKIDADGVFDYDPDIGDLEVARFYPDNLEDEFSQTSWTLEGRLNRLELLYTGAYLDRDIDQLSDFTSYNNSGAFIAYYTCTYTNPDYIATYGISPDVITPVRECKDPSKGFIGIQQHRRLTHEFRIATDPKETLSAIAGIFYDDFEIKTQDEWWYAAATELGFAPNAPIAAANNINDNTRAANITFFNDITRTEEQIALFGELKYDFSQQLSLTLGLRWYDIESDFTGSSNFGDGIFQGSQNTDRGRDYDVSGGHSEDPLEADGIIPKISLSYQRDKNSLYYLTYAEGFRPGGFNRTGGFSSFNPDFPDINLTYESDDVYNYELGWKTLSFERQLLFNGNIYFIEWENMQVSRFDPINVSRLTFIENAANAEIFGAEMDLAWDINENLTVHSALSYNHTELTDVKARIIEIAPTGSELPLTPKVQANIRTNYYWQQGEYEASWQLGLQYAGKSWSSVVSQERKRQNSYTIINFSLGVKKDNWSVKLYGDNLTDKRADLFINNQDFVTRITTNRPRTFGVSFSYDYN